ncbi:hypothetical protein [Natronospira bacteriovora]|uniref:Big-1 domain-containing protein n=1 Tax=Natronospira bacteriovora TaxID=3069753 RepID=A0ABU0W848_9GAMM|nr:hypothetical protein [Natronospira sp. AB-CW4]MDQ2070205.1 hypothetical protein [Natronospira sp. AB-CW4]
MNMRFLLALIFMSFIALAGCESDTGTMVQPGTGTDAPDDDDDDDDDTDPGEGATGAGLILGSGEGEDFQAGVLELGMSTIASGGSTGVMGRLVDEDGNPPSQDYQVNLTSTCVEEGIANILSPVTAIGGEFQSTYTAQGCAGEDTITATVNVGDGGDSVTLVASATVEVEEATLGSLVFVDADPQLIGLRGMGVAGISETSTVTFQVQDTQGNPTPGRNVQFSLSTSVGGIALSTELSTSNSQGLVTTQVISGTVATSVRVNARVVDTNVTSQSSQLSISTGIAEEAGISLGLDIYNPPVQRCLGARIPIRVHARDRFSNPVVDGTVVHFSTEGGRIQSSCMTEDGECEVEWVSQDPMPMRSTILAYMEGEESFKDRTGDGLFGTEEASFGPHQGSYDWDDPDEDESIGWIDTGEPFRDDNESGSFEPGIDGFFWDYHGTGEWTGPNSLYDGALCGYGIEDEATREQFQEQNCGLPQAPIGRQTVMVLADNLNVSIDAPASYTVGGAPLTFTVSGPMDQTLPLGSTIALETDYGEVLGQDTVTIGNTNFDGPNVVEFIISESGEEDTSICEIGVITVTTPADLCGGAGVIVQREIEICGSTS